jgi:hypothetical protein
MKEICNLSLFCRKVYRAFSSNDVKVKGRGRKRLATEYSQRQKVKDLISEFHYKRMCNIFTHALPIGVDPLISGNIDRQ